MQEFIIISILVIIAGIFIVLRMKQKHDKKIPLIHLCAKYN